MTDSTKPYLILAAVDYSTASDLALERALELASEKRSAAVHVVNVLPVYQAGSAIDSQGTEGAWTGTLPSVKDAAEQLRVYAQQRIDAFRGPAGVEGATSGAAGGRGFYVRITSGKLTSRELRSP